MGYTDTAKAAAEQRKRIWYGYVGAGLMWAGLTVWSRGSWIEPFMWWGTFVGWGISTAVCLWLSARVGRQEHRARRDALEGGEVSPDELSPRERWERPLPPEVEAQIERDAVVDGYYSGVRADRLRMEARRERAERENE